MPKLSEIALANTPPASSDTVVGVRGGNTDQQFTLTQLASTIGGGGGGGTSAVTYYIAANGSDANNGTSQSTPWQTITHVNSVVVQPGTAFLFRVGDTFSGALVASASGTKSLPVIYGSYNDSGNAGQVAPLAATATISSGSSNGFTATDLSFITVQNLNFVGGGFSNTNNGIQFANATVPFSNITIKNCVVQQYSLDGILFSSTQNGGINDTITVTGCTIHDCPSDGIKLSPQGGSVVGRTPQSLSYSNVTITNNTVYYINGQNGPIADTAGFGIRCQAVDGFVISGNVIHDIARNSNSSPFGHGGPGIYVADDNNGHVFGNECYNIGDLNTGNGGNYLEGILIDFGTTNLICEQNYLHDCLGSGIGMDSDLEGGNVRPYGNNYIRYNIIANCGFVSPGGSQGGGITIIILNTAVVWGQVGPTLYHNNTIYYNIPGLGGAFQLFPSSAGGVSCFFWNNLFICGSAAIIKVISTGVTGNNMFFTNNAYFGGNPQQRSIISGVPSGSVSDNVGIDGATPTTLTADPLLSSNYPIYTSYTNVTSAIGQQLQIPAIPPDQNSAVQFQLGPSSPYAFNGLNPSAYSLVQAKPIPYAGGIDFSFSGQNYNGSVIGDIACSRTSTAGTDLLFNDPVGRVFNTFAANTLRITTGRGLLVEEGRQQMLANPAAPATQTITLTTTSPGPYFVLWMNGTGSVVLTAGTGAFTVTRVGAVPVAAQNWPVSFQMTGNGTVTFTVNGNVNQFQCESDPTGARCPTSFINGQTTRDADVVTSGTGTTFGAALQGALGNAGLIRGAQVSCNIPFGYGTFPNDVGMIFSDNSNSSQLYLYSGNAYYPYCAVQSFFVCGGQSTSSPINSLTNSRLAISWQANQPGQLISQNGSAVSSAGTTASPTLTTPMYLGSQNGTSKFLNGYIQRFISYAAAVISNAQMQVDSSVTPLAPVATRDFFGNQVPAANGTFSIGAHQPQIPGLASLTVADQLVSGGGANAVAVALPTGNVTIDCGKGAIQKITNNGAFTITAPATDGSCLLMSTNGASAGTITFSGFSVGASTGDSLDTTNGHIFTLSIWRINGVSSYRVAAQQ